MVEAKRNPIKELKDRVESNDGCLTLSGGELRSACGFQRLRPGVRARIPDMLVREGLGVYPLVPDDQREMVRVYQLGTDVARIIDTVANPSIDGDEKLQEWARQSGGEIIEQIKALVESY